MEPEAKYTVVGATVLVLLAMIVAAIVWLKSSGGEGNETAFKIYFAKQSLEGLQIRSDVKMQGIRVGAVTGFRISARRPGSVEVLIRVDGATPVRMSTRAMVERQLLTGIASIRLTNADEDSPLLTAAPPDEPYPLIAEGESEYKLTESMAQVAQRADETMQRINIVLSDENQVALSEILINLRRISGDMSRSMAGFDRTLASLGGAADEVRSMSIAVREDAQRLASRYDALGETSAVAVRDIAAAVARMSADVGKLSGRMDALLADGNVELRVTAQELRTTADALGAAARRLGDPSRALFGPAESALGPGERAK
ncbi:MAG: MCE family protein [Burkholderiales bacterium]|nr:MCE family protein [Burkholderiales bacterium]